tara:strand:+ start:4360 stop:4875 length:516 start_codon:yes stop_codon:yes gene_type:complete
MSIKPILKKCAYIFSICALFLHSGCGALNKGTFDSDETGAYTRHFWSCGPNAISDVMHQIEKSYYSDEEISKEIQKNGNIRRFTLAIFDEEAMAITWPSEVKKYFTKRNFTITKTPFNSLKEGDVAIILIRKGLKYHWIAYPTYTKKIIKKYFGDSTVVVGTYIIKKRAAN